MDEKKLRRIKRTDNTFLGFGLGLIFPVIGFLIYYLLKFLPMHISLQDFINVLKTNKHLIPAVLSLCLLANAAIFFICTHFRKDLTARGILVATLIYGVIIVILKLQ